MSIFHFKAPKRNLISWILDTSIYYSFDQSGFHRHLRHSLPINCDLSTLHILITGANAGIGRACAFELAKHNAQLSLLCRDPVKGHALINDLLREYPHLSKENLNLIIADLGDFSTIDRISLKKGHKLNGVIHNAGLLPKSYKQTKSGLEQTLAVHLAGPLRLTYHLSSYFDFNHPYPFRVLWMSSGGMYTKPLSLKALHAIQDKEYTYDGVEAYAYTKRAQVEIASFMAESVQLSQNWEVHSLHPGWVDTPGLQNSLPFFWRWTHKRLRTAKQGADTAVWLSACPNSLPCGFWFDRLRRNPYLLGHRPTHQQSKEVWKQICSWADISHNWT